CGEDKPVSQIINVFNHLTQGEPYNRDVQIWTNRSEYLRDITLNWIVHVDGYFEGEGHVYWNRRLKTRPNGDITPAHELKEKWLDEFINSNEWTKKVLQTRKCPIEYVFESDPDSVAMFR